LRIYPTQKWKQLSDVSLFHPSWIDKNYYIRLKQVKREHLLGVTP